jgi:hypothetical protein
MLGIVLVQGFHEIEHIVQVIQRFVLDNPKGAGVLGTWLDVEPVHIGYNAAFLALIGLVYWQGQFWRQRGSRPVAFYLMTFALLFQSYHFVEHLFKIVQFIDTGKNGTPGILGHVFNLVWLHFWFNTIVYSVMFAAFLAGGFPKAIMEWLRPRRRTVAAA